MKKKLLIIAPFAIVIALVALAFFMKKENANRQSWAYDYEPTKEILSLGSRGKATYKGVDYTYDKDGQFITFSKSGEDSFKIRYEMTEDENGAEAMFFYEPKYYTYSSETQQNGLIGLWKSEDGSSFEFNEAGTFMEDGYFYGFYTVEEDQGRIKLIYDSNFRFNDSYIYYQIEGDQIRVEYPWRLFRCAEEQK